MKKITLIAASLFAMLSSYNLSAQTFTLDKDTSRKYWAATGVDVEPGINATASGSADITITWSIAYYNLASKWTFGGFCDNKQCYGEGEAGLTNGLNSFSTIADKAFNFHAIFNGDAADNGTQSVISASMNSGGTTTMGTFIAIKSATGISTTFKKEETVSIFPNPAQNYIDVIYNASSDVKTIAIYNLIGKAVNVYKVTDKNSAHCEFNADMPSGIYVVRIADSKGNIIATRKITRQ